jgi:serine/threonine-protein kinase
MDPDRWTRVQEILVEALQLAASERASFLDRACGEDRELRSEVESLLGASEAADGYFGDLADRVGIENGSETSPDETPQDLEGRRVGAYRLGRLLGRGGMGAVYLAKRADGQFELTAALKLLTVGAATEEGHRRFLSERHILARLEHQNIARLLDGGVIEDGTPYFVMEYVRGLPLTEFCDRRVLDLEERLQLFLDVCDSVAYAHRKLVIHRDLKPSNILVTDEGTVKLLDFGIARLVAGEDAAAAPTAGVRMMTPRYASPEQLRGEEITTSSDVYALGVVLHELLTGLSPYDLEDGTTTLVDAICNRPVDTPSTRLARTTSRRSASEDELPGLQAASIGRRLRGDLDNILLMALRKEPERRYPSVEAFADDVRRHLTGYPVRARPESLKYVTSRFLRRHALAVGSAGALALLLAALVVISIRFAVTTSEQARHLAVERDKAEEMTTFLRELFEVANPALTSGETITARELLDRGAERIRAEHRDDPELASEMLTVLGTVYNHLGLPEPALQLLREARAVQERSAALPPDHEAETLHQLGLALRESGEADEAVSVLREARDLMEELYGPDHRLVAIATANLARAMHGRGAVTEAEPEFRRAIETFRSLEVELDEEYAWALYLLADYLQVSGESEGIEEMYREALSVIETLYGRSHPNVPPILSGLAWWEQRQGDAEAATALLREALAIDIELFRDVEGGSHPSLGISYHTLGRHLANTGDDPEETERMLKESLRIFETATQPRPDYHGQAELTLGTFMRSQGRLDEAMSHYRSASRIFREAFGAGSVMEAGVQVDMADLLVTLGQDDEARPLLQAALEAYGDMLPPTHYRMEQIRTLMERVGAG